MKENGLISTLKSVYEDTKSFVIKTYKDIRSNTIKSIVAVAVLATLLVGVLSLFFSAGDGVKKRVITVQHTEHTYQKTAEAPKVMSAKPDEATSTEEDVTAAQDTLGNGDSIDGAGIQTQYMKYTVDKKESLYAIAKKIYGSSHYWVLIYERNKHIIKDPDLIFEGQVIEVPFRSDGNLSWDKEELVENYIEIYKTYRKHEKLSEVYWLLYTGVKRIDPDLLEHYKIEVKKFDRAFARGEISGIPPERNNKRKM